MFTDLQEATTESASALTTEPVLRLCTDEKKDGRTMRDKGRIVWRISD